MPEITTYPGPSTYPGPTTFPGRSFVADPIPPDPTAITVTVLLDGIPLADTRPEFLLGEATVMTDLELDWGRSTVVDQPDVDAVTFEVAQRGNGADLLDLLRAGRRVDVQAAGILYPDPDTAAVIDPSFEATMVGSDPGNVQLQNAAGTVTAETAHTGTQSFRIAAKDMKAPVTAVFAPAPFQKQNPIAWDQIPTTDVGQLWHVGASVQIAAGATATVQPVLFDGPAGTYVLVGAPQQVFGRGVWQTVLLELNPPTKGKWVGVAVTIQNIAPAWQSLSGSWSTTPGTWLDYNEAFVDDLVVTSPPAGTTRTVLMFAGRLTDAEASFDRELVGGSLRVKCTARSFPAELANTPIGDEPWAVESLGDRVDRILQLAGANIQALVDPAIASIPVTWRDVDSQPAAGLITELATSAAGVAWSAAHITTGAYYWLEDPDQRSSILKLHEDPDSGEIGIIDTRTAADAITLDASNVLVDPLRWVQDVSGIGTRIDITWQEQTLDDNGQPAPTERHVVLVDSGLEAEYGRRNLSLSTQLQAEADALSVGTRMLARVALTGWRLQGIEWRQKFETEMTPRDIASTLNLLDGTIRIGSPILIQNIPSWVPLPPQVNAYIEGGQYRYERVVSSDGRIESAAWDLQLTAVQSAGIGSSVAWDELDSTWLWHEFAPAIQWDQLIGVGPGT